MLSGYIPYLRPMPRKVYTDDPRVHTIASMVEQKKITTLGQIFRWVPKTAIADALGVHVRRVTGMILRPGSITLDEADALADLFGIERDVFMKLIRAHRREVLKGGYSLPKLDYGVGE